MPVATAKMLGSKMMSSGGEAHLAGQQVVGAGADFDLAVGGVGLALFVEGHDDDGGPVAAAKPRLLKERDLAFLHADRVHDRLALHAFQPGLDHLPLGAVDHQGNAGDVGLCGDQVEEGGHGGGAVDQPLVHVHVDDLGAVFHLVAGHVQRSRKVARRHQLAKAGAAGDVRALAHVDERDVLGLDERLEAGQPKSRRDLRDRARGQFGHGGGDRGDVVGCRSAAAADDIDQPLSREIGDLARHRGGAFIVFAHFVGQTRVRIGADQGVGDLGQFGQVRAHRVGAKGAVQPDSQRPGVADRVPERRRRLSRQGAARQVGDGAGNHDRQDRAGLLEHLVGGEDRGLGVQRVEDRLDQDQVGAARDQAADLFGIGHAQLVEGDGAKARIVHVGADRRGAVCRPQRPRDPARPPVAGRRPIERAPRQQRPLAVQLIDAILHRVVGLRDGGGRKGVRFHDVGTRQRIAEMDVLDRLGLGQVQQVVVALLGVVGVNMAATAAAVVRIAQEVAFAQPQVLDLRPHRPVEDQDALACGGADGVESGGKNGHGDLRGRF